jgi:ABC-2 type transport system ATP-binding protein
VYRRIRSNRIVEIKVLDRLESALSIVRSRPETLNVQTTDHTITAELAAEDEQLASLMEQLLAGGVRMRSFGEKDPTLEDVFMLVTKGLVT